MMRESKVLAPLMGEARSLVVMLHGYGSIPKYLEPYAHAWQSVLPHTAFALLPGWEVASTGGRSWFDLKTWDGRTLLSQHVPCVEPLKAASARAVAHVEDLMGALKLCHADVALMGFSQGAMMVLQMGLSFSKPCAGVVACAGALLACEQDVKSKPPVLLVHGSADTAVVPLEADRAYEKLKGWGVKVHKDIRPRLGHAIDEGATEKIGTFLVRCLGA